MSDHDHLEPLPEATPRNMAHMFFRGLIVGAIAILLDAWITQKLLGFEYPYIIFALAVIAIPAITGACRDDGLPIVLSLLSGIIVGILATNTLRVLAAGQPSVLAGVGM